ncbi:protein rolling stone-like [Acanthaster planci]|uniref:Protein rolling stone-like n=1 Tax=Acanthaster planci TaxID=133434 RepID=A0A8B7XZQ8_ACAPL|nr:protein rolling stone-like [Acanthaster planci]
MKCCKRPTLSDLKLNVEDSGVFYRSQWTRLPALVFVAYRVLLALYLLGVYIALLVELIPSYGGSIFIFLTNIAFTVFVVYLLIAGSIAVLDGYILRRRNSADMGVRHMIHWLLFNVTVNVNLIVTIVYWVGLYDPARGGFFFSFHVHAVTSIVSVADLVVTAVPVRLLHAVYPCVSLVAYMVLTLVYWGTSNGIVYPFLDYSCNPGLAAGSIVGIFLAILSTQVIVWAIYKLRVGMWKKCGGDGETTQAEIEQDKAENGL